MKKLNLALALLTSLALIVFGIAACDVNEPPSGPSVLSGIVSIPEELVVGMNVIADTTDLRGSGTPSYVWETGASENGTFTPIVNAVGSSFFVEEEGNVAVGRFLRVTVTREGREGSKSSNAARIFEAASITGVEIIFEETGVDTGSDYSFSALVTHDRVVAGEDPSGIFQEVKWSVTGNTSVNTRFSKEVLTVGSNETAASITVTAASVINPAVISDPMELTVTVRRPPPPSDGSILYLNIASIAALMAGTSGIEENPPDDDGPWYYISNAKTAIETGTYEVEFLLEELIDAGNYDYLVFEIMGDSPLIFRDISNSFPRLRNSEADGDAWVQFRGESLKNRTDGLIGQANVWGKVVIDITASNVHSGGPHEAVMPSIDIVLLRIITTSTSSPAGRIYFRNLHLTNDRPYY